MTWDVFYSRYSEWSDRTLRSRISMLEDIGRGDEFSEVLLNICDDELETALILKAVRYGVKLSPEDYASLEGEINYESYILLERFVEKPEAKPKKHHFKIFSPSVRNAFLLGKSK